MTGRYVKPKPGEKTGHYLPCEKCGKVRCECLELRFLAILKADAIPLPPEREYRFSDVRVWRADFAYPDVRILVEIEGGGGKGRHTSVAGFRQDCIKYNAATALGWKVYRFDGVMLTKGIAAKTMKAALGDGGPYVPTVAESTPKRRKTPENARKSRGSTKKPEKARIPTNDTSVIRRKQTVDPVRDEIEKWKASPAFREEVAKPKRKPR
jgi:hypothetical protein